MTDQVDRETELAALRAALAGEHAAMWGYGVLGPRLSSEQAGWARRSYESHRVSRDRLETLLLDRGVDPDPARPAYELPFPVDGPGSARRLARHLEDGCAAVYADLVAATADPDLRTLAASQLVECARRGLDYGGKPVAFPGLPER